MKLPQSLQEMKHRTLHHIELRDGFLYIQLGLRLHVPVDIEYIETFDPNKMFLLIDRKNNIEISFPLYTMTRDSDFLYLEGKIDLLSHPELAVEDALWDAYICVDYGDNQKQYRVKSGVQELEFFYVYFETADRLLVPYTTNKGNVSFKTLETNVIAKVEKACLSKKGILSLSGYAFCPLWDVRNDKDIIKRVVLRDSNDDFEGNDIFKGKFAAKNIERNDLDDNYKHGDFKWSGFQIDLDLRNVDIPSDVSSLRVCIELELSNENKGEILESPPLKIEYQEDGSKLIDTVVLKKAAEKKRFTLKNTKSLNLSLAVSNYSFLGEVRSKIIKFKRGPKVKKLYKNAFKLVGRLPARKNLIMFESFHGKQYSDNPRAIYEYLQEHHPAYKMYWSADKRHVNTFRNKNLKYVKKFSIRWLFLMARARYWVINTRMPLWLPKPKHTIFLQTWHGTPLKRLANDMDEVHMPGTNTKKYKKNFTREARRWDYLVSPNAYSTIIFRRAFKFRKKMIESGYPRNDYLYTNNNQENISQLKSKYGIPLDKKVILYAPTWRDDQFYSKGCYKFDLDLDLVKMREQLGDDYVVILRMHYLIAENFDLTPYKGFAYDFSNHEDIRDLYLVADLLITDYSSVFFDYANLRRPIIFYCYDIDRYRTKLRGFYFDIEKHAPGPLVKSTDEVIEAIHDFENKHFALPETFENFYKRFCYLESGESAKKVVEEVFFNQH
ncbi:CDP-glycerol glycerophosphotransferase [Scopulibacillus daqui]|uniref:CDP-glycerol glycerophosphotransferase n=1 Tax=Scopulibacillus daqui TaxID=1469162 RepID=A0ABS2Q3W9_9BACL|nr:CDP-glycerol glycerophosphotransferase family protein [Scopulibacillus daqui]MBM7646996.1 CDP-glycerol glycerophosphotransferase [Scopulibacillus daqui]